MSRIEINREHQLSDQERQEALDDLAAYLASIGAKLSREGDRLAFSGRGYEGSVVMTSHTARGTVKLGLLARPFQSQLEKAIHQHLEARLSGAR
jgi:putative polyhydroxyalkanoate system protein